MIKKRLILFLVMFLLGSVITFYMIEQNKKHPLAPVKGFETIAEPIEYDIPLTTTLEEKKFGNKNDKPPKGYQIIENEHGTFLLAYIQDTFEYTHIANYTQNNTQTHIQLVLYYIQNPNDNQFSMKFNYKDLLGVYKLKEKPKNSIIVEYYEYETESWKQLSEVDFLLN